MGPRSRFPLQAATADASPFTLPLKLTLSQCRLNFPFYAAVAAPDALLFKLSLLPVTLPFHTAASDASLLTLLRLTLPFQAVADAFMLLPLALPLTLLH